VGLPITNTLAGSGLTVGVIDRFFDVKVLF
jgi:hypothetical protein